jgi:hypothetical protein
MTLPAWGWKWDYVEVFFSVSEGFVMEATDLEMVPPARVVPVSPPNSPSPCRLDRAGAGSRQFRRGSRPRIARRRV